MADSEILFLEYRDRLSRYLARASGSPDTAQDLVQEVFLRVARSPAPAADTAQAGPWLFRVARNVVIDHHRRNRRTPTFATTEIDHHRQATQETTIALDQALAMLEDTDRDVFLMREVSGLSYDEIARACELSPDAARSRIYRARMQLRETLAPHIALAHKQPLRHSGRPA